MCKTKFGDSLRSKSETGQTNEVLLKFLCHNLVVLNHAMHTLDIDPFDSEVGSRAKVIDLSQYR